MKLFRCSALSQTYTLAEVARLPYTLDVWLDELSELHVHQRWPDSNGNWWERLE